jgi:two-component system, cell cycle sensor histidine kinase and response regulator CckA
MFNYALTMIGVRNHIVVVDDEPDLSILFSEAVKSAGFESVSFDDPLAALQYIRDSHSKIALLLTDWKMPQMNGYELMKQVTKIDESIKVMLMSAFELEKDKLREINMNAYLRKPIHITQLIDAVKNIYKETLSINSSDQE